MQRSVNEYCYIVMDGCMLHEYIGVFDQQQQQKIQFIQLYKNVLCYT